MVTKSYDSRCYDLAAIFLSDEPGLDNETHRGQLAMVIQGTIEEYIKLELPSPEETGPCA